MTNDKAVVSLMYFSESQNHVSHKFTLHFLEDVTTHYTIMYVCDQLLPREFC